MQSSICAIIPARYHSSRFEGKPLAKINGKPMIQHVVERAQASTLLNPLLVATHDIRIAETVDAFGGTSVMTQKNHASGTDRLAEAAEKLDLDSEDVIVNIQGDQPLFAPEIVEEVARPLLEDATLSMSTLIYEIVLPEEIDNPNHVKVVFDNQWNALYFSRAAIPYCREKGVDLPVYYKHLGFYAYRKKFLSTFVSLPMGQWEHLEKLEQLRALENGYTIRVVLTKNDSAEVDTPMDIIKVENLLRQQGQLA